MDGQDGIDGVDERGGRNERSLVLPNKVIRRRRGTRSRERSRNFVYTRINMFLYRWRADT